MDFVRDVALRATVLEGPGRDSEAKSLRRAAMTGIASDDMRALGNREIAVQGTIMREISNHLMRLDEVDGAK